MEDAEEHVGTHGLLVKWSKIEVNYRAQRWGIGNAPGRRTRTLNFNRIICLAGLYFAFPATLTLKMPAWESREIIPFKEVGIKSLLKYCEYVNVLADVHISSVPWCEE